MPQLRPRTTGIKAVRRFAEGPVLLDGCSVHANQLYREGSLATPVLQFRGSHTPTQIQCPGLLGSTARRPRRPTAEFGVVVQFEFSTVLTRVADAAQLPMHDR